MGTKTQNYQLNQWEATDNFLRTDFNEDNGKIDSALKALDDKVNTKANQSDLTGLTSTVNTKAAQTSVDALTAAMPKIVTGTYTGTGTYGTTNRNTLTFNIKPKIVFIFKPNFYGPFANTQSTGSCCGIMNQIFYYGGTMFGVFDGKTGTVNYTLTDHTLTWYADITAGAQMNAINVTYSYIAIG